MISPPIKKKRKNEFLHAQTQTHKQSEESAPNPFIDAFIIRMLTHSSTPWFISTMNKNTHNWRHYQRTLRIICHDWKAIFVQFTTFVCLFVCLLSSFHIFMIDWYNKSQMISRSNAIIVYIVVVVVEPLISYIINISNMIPSNSWLWRWLYLSKTDWQRHNPGGQIALIHPGVVKRLKWGFRLPGTKFEDGKKVLSSAKNPSEFK